MILDKISKEISVPSVLEETEQFVIKLAVTPEEIEKALRLRYEIFNLEQGKGLDSASESGIDSDEYDEYCLHLIVLDKKTNAAVGTYRIHLGSIANSAIGFYSAREYDIKGLDAVARKTMEVGRSCVSPEFRTGAAVALLWSGISELLRRSKLRYLLGCVSLETVDPAVGWSLYEYFQTTGKISEMISAVPKDTFNLMLPERDKIEEVLADRKTLIRHIPPLLKGYLRLGTKICGLPALDHEFGTIDYLIILDVVQLPERYARHFISNDFEAE